MLSFGQRLKELRNQKDLTQDQLAQRLWVTKSIISAYESGARYPSLDMLIKLSQTFNTTTDYLLGVNKSESLNITNLSKEQKHILNKLVDEFQKNK